MRTDTGTSDRTLSAAGVSPRCSSSSRNPLVTAASRTSFTVTSKTWAKAWASASGTEAVE
ncbi:hypothetical protein AB0F15_11980 [Amycolatopsis sp. NPDC026612]|uniref:hypothetical protein n=1 Tax=Amycolatopsis sp. NPDC026612 TaxID=3155466 RepID=UPI0033F2F644